MMTSSQPKPGAGPGLWRAHDELRGNQLPFRRYARQLALIGVEAQEKLFRSSALIVGVGGLGSMEALLLAYLGIGRLVLVDKDTVEESNLNRQVLHWETDMGKAKVLSAKEKIERINSSITVEAVHQPLSEELLEDIVPRVDIVMDGLDNWESRFLVDRVAWRKGKPFIHAGVDGFYGQVAPIARGRTPCLRCIVGPVPRERREVQVVVPTIALVASIAVTEALKVLTGVSRPAYGKMIVADLLSYDLTVVDISGLGCGLCGE